MTLIMRSDGMAVAWLGGRILAAMLLVSATSVARTAGSNAPQSNAPAWCARGERVLFGCSARAKTIAVCAAGRHVRYLYGAPGKAELVYPAGPGQGTMYQASTSYVGGGEAQIGFVADDNRYVVYSRTVRTEFGAGGFNPRSSAGVMIFRAGKQLGDRRCTRPADAALDASAARELLPEGMITMAQDQ